MSIRTRLWKKVFIWFLVLVTLVCWYIFIFHWHYYDEFISSKALLIGILSMIALYFSLVDGDARSKWRKFINRIAVFPLIIGIGAFLYFLQGLYYDYQLKEYGEHTTATVVDLYKVRNRTNYIHYAKIVYTCNYEERVHRVLNTDGWYKKGDCLEIICSKDEPEIFRVVEPICNR